MCTLPARSQPSLSLVVKKVEKESREIILYNLTFHHPHCLSWRLECVHKISPSSDPSFRFCIWWVHFFPSGLQLTLAARFARKRDCNELREVQAVV